MGEYRKRQRKCTYRVYDTDFDSWYGRLYWHGCKRGWLRGNSDGHESTPWKWCRNLCNAMKHARRINAAGGRAGIDQNTRRGGRRVCREMFLIGDK